MSAIEKQRKIYQKQLKAGKFPKPVKFKRVRWRDPEEYRQKQQQEDNEREGFLGNWNYQNPDKRGPQGETLPKGAVGWTPHGEAYFGDGLQGWINEHLSRISNPQGKPPEEIVARTMGRPGGGPLERETIDLGATIANWWRDLGTQETPIGTAARTAQEAVGMGIEAIGEVGKKTKQVMSLANYPITTRISNPVRQKQIDRGEIRTPYGFVVKKDDPQWETWFKKFAPPHTTVEPHWFGKYGTFDNAWQSGRILYSTWLDPALRGEYVRRYQAGENPYMLAMELENPMAEMAGEMVFDPLNIVGPGWLKPLTKQRRVDDAVELFYKTAPELGEWLAKGPALSEGNAINRLQDLVEIQRTKSAKVAEGLGRYATKRGVFNLTADGKRFEIGQIVHELGNWIAKNNDPDEALEIYDALVKVNSGDPDMIADGLSTFKRLDTSQVYLSQAGDTFGTVIGRLLKDADGKVNPGKFLDELQAAKEGSMDDVMALVSRKTDDAVKDLFPSFGDMQDAAKAVRGGKGTPRQIALAKAWDEAGGGAKALFKFHEAVQKGIYRPINSFLSGVYMGLSPAYASRNFMTNEFHVAVDAGLSAIFKRPSVAKDEILKMLGGVLPEGAFGYGKGSLGMDIAQPGGLFGYKLGEKGEEIGAIQTIRKSIRDTLGKELKVGRALPDLKVLTDAGLSDDAARLLARKIIDNWGDVDAVLPAFLQEAKSGQVALFRSLDWLPDDDLKRLRDFNKESDVLEAILSSKTPDEAISKLDSIYDDMMKQADRVADDMPAVADDAEDVVYLAAASKDLPDAINADITNYIQANINAFDAHQDVALRLIDASDTEILQARDRTLAVASQLRQQEHAFSNKWFGWPDRIRANKNISVAEAWKELGMTTPVPQNQKELFERFWSEYFFPKRHEYYVQMRELYASMTEAIAKNVGDNPLIKKARIAEEQAKWWDDKVVSYQAQRFKLENAKARGDVKTSLAILADRFGVQSTFVEKGTGAVRPWDKHLVDVLNAEEYGGIGRKITSLDELTPADIDNIEKVFAKRRAIKDAEAVVKGGAPEAAKVIEPPLKVPYAGNQPTEARVLDEQREGLEQLFGRVKAGITDNWGKYAPAQTNRQVEKAINLYAKDAKKRIGEARLIAAAVADAAREFTMLAYPKKRYSDLALAYIFPYHFWYTHTYANWLKRIAQSPEVIAAYAKYRDALAKIHAGAPEWWKYNINSNELLGLDSDNPLFFNLEATLNPVNGLTGVDFTDPYKRIDWWTKGLDDMNKLGPSTWTPFNIATALALKLRGEEDAAARWGGRLIPQTQTLKALGSIMNVNIPTLQGINETDPNVLFFSNGQDPYETKRVARALWWMGDNGEITEEEAIEAARTHSGPAWFEATKRAIRDRAGSQLFSFFLGVGFKARNTSDIEIDRFDAEWRKLWNFESDKSPEEFREEMDQLRDKYPFMDAVLLSRKGSELRDRSYAYNVLGRIPPGQKDDLAKLLGVDYKLFDKFYNDKGHMEKWAETDRQKFMAAMVDLGAVLRLSDAATRTEWNGAKDAYSKLMEDGKKLYGEDIWSKVDTYYSKKGEGVQRNVSDAYLEANPDVAEALDWKTNTITSNPLLNQYYGGIETVERYWKGVMYNALEILYGEDIFDIQQGYFDAKLTGDQRKYLKQHPELIEMWDKKTEYEGYIAENIASVADLLKEPTFPELMVGTGSLGQQEVLGALQNEQPTPYDYTWQEWRGMMTPPLERLVVDYVRDGEKLSAAARDQLEYMAGGLDIDPDLMLELMEQSWLQQ